MVAGGFFSGAGPVREGGQQDRAEGDSSCNAAATPASVNHTERSGVGLTFQNGARLDGGVWVFL